MKRSSSSKDLKLSKADKKAKRNVKIKFTLHLKSLLNLSPALNDSDVSIAWKRGSKKSNRGESESVRVQHGAADWKKPQQVVVEATLIQYPTLHKFQQKTVEFTLRQTNEKKKTTNVTAFEVDLAQYATDKTDETITFPIVASKSKTKSSSIMPPITPTITFNIKAEWLKIGNKKIVSRNRDGDDYDLQTDIDEDESETDFDESEAESDSDTDESEKGGKGGMDLSYSLDYPVAAPSPVPVEAFANGMQKEIEKELKQLQKEVKDLKKEISERDQVLAELIELRIKFDDKPTKKESKKDSSGPKGWKEMKKEIMEVKRWMERKEDEVNDLRKEVDKSKGKKKSSKENDVVEEVDGGKGEVDDLKKRLKDREEELKRAMKQLDDKEEEMQRMQQIIEKVSVGDKSGTIKLTNAQLKTMSGELKVKKELELEREKAKQKEKELDSANRSLKAKEDEVKKLTKNNEQQEKKMKKLQEELEQVKQEMVNYKKLAESAVGGGTSNEGSFGSPVGLLRKKKTEDLAAGGGDGLDGSGPWKVGGGVIDASDRSEGSEKSKKKKKKKDKKNKEKEASPDNPYDASIPMIQLSARDFGPPAVTAWAPTPAPSGTNSNNVTDLKQQIEENETLEKCIYCADTSQYFTYEISLPMAVSMDYADEVETAKVTLQAGIPVAAKELFIFLRETEALTAHGLNQPLLQRILNALSICIERSSANVSVQCYWMSFVTSLLIQIASDKQISLQPGLDAKLMRKFKNVEKKGIQFDVNSAKPPRSKEEYVGFFVRQMNMLVLRTFANMHAQMRAQILPILLPSILGQNNILKSHYASNNDSIPALLAVKSTPKDITRLLSNFMDELARNFIFPSIVKQFLMAIYRTINVVIFNALMSRRELCTAFNGYQIRFGLAQLTAWPFEVAPTTTLPQPQPPSPRGSMEQEQPKAPPSHTRVGSPRAVLPVSSIYFDVIDAGPIVQELEPTLEAAGVLVLDKTQLNSDDGLRHAAPFLHPVHLNHLLLSFTPDDLSPNPVPDKPKKLLSMILSRETNVPPLLLVDAPPVRLPGDPDDSAKKSTRPAGKLEAPPSSSGPAKQTKPMRGNDSSEAESDDTDRDDGGGSNSTDVYKGYNESKQRWTPATATATSSARKGGREEDDDDDDDDEEENDGYGKYGGSSSSSSRYNDWGSTSSKSNSKRGGGGGGSSKQGGYSHYGGRSDDDDDDDLM